MTKCRKGTQFRAIGLSKMDIVSAIEDRAANHSLSTIYMATDGWIRGTKGLALVKEVRNEFLQYHCLITIMF